MTEAGLDAEIDGVGNVFGRSPNAGPALLLGSHSDTQPEGGWLDGAMGVMDAIEVARALLSDPATSHLAVDAVAWSDEEGTYTNCLGSTSFVGDLTVENLAERDAAGESVAEAIARVGLTDMASSRFDPARQIGYLEAHIEQGPHLEETGKRIGVVTSIVGIRGAHVRFVGEQNHAGTTSMARRKDAAVAMFEFGAALQPRMADIASPTSVWTIGRVTVEPGAPSIVPGFAEVAVQFRDPDDEVLQRMLDVVVDLAAEIDRVSPVDVVAVRGESPIMPTVMHRPFIDHIGRAAEQHVPGAWVEMPSAAGHDPMVISRHLPCAMLFVPSIGGVSHDFAEDSHHDDIVLGCQILADATASILRASS